MRYSFFILFLFIANISMSQQTEKINIPKGVKYSYASKEINKRSKDVLLKEIKNSTYSLFNNLVYCGPNLNILYKRNESFSKIEKGNITFKVPQHDGSIRNETGKLIQTLDDYKIIWSLIIADISNEKIKIRKANSFELEYFWSIIFYDIKEPLWVIETDNIKFIIDIDSNNNLIFIEAI